MYLANKDDSDSDLKPLRGKTLLLFADLEVAAPDVLKHAVQKMRTFNKDMQKGPYILLYPDCSEVVHVSGSERPFKLAEYKIELERLYSRITFFICLETYFKRRLVDLMIQYFFFLHILDTLLKDASIYSIYLICCLFVFTAVDDNSGSGVT